MFSREEITSSTPKPEKREIVLKDLAEEVPAGDTEEEEVFELSSPMVDAVDSIPDQNDEDVFNLEELQSIRDDKSEIEVPDIQFADVELPEPGPRRRPAAGPAPAGPVQTIDLPVTLEIPDDADSVQVRLNLKITVKKK